MAGKRDSDYFKRRLKRDHPRVYSHLVAGRYESVRSAAVAAGLIKPSTRLAAIKREWRGASLHDRKEFLEWLKAGGATSRPPARPTRIADSHGRLVTAVVTFLKKWTADRKVTPGRIMKEMGFSNYDYRLAHVLQSAAPLPQEVLDKLGPWLRRQGFV